MQFKRTVLIFWTNYPKSRKSEHHDWILHIQISLRTKFNFKQTVLNLGTKFAQEGYFRTKMEKSRFCVCPWSLLTILNLLNILNIFYKYEYEYKLCLPYMIWYIQASVNRWKKTLLDTLKDTCEEVHVL